MTIRIEVQPDSAIEIMRPNASKTQFYKFTNMETALIVIKFLIKRDIEKARGERFVPQIEKEAIKAFNQLKEKSPYATQKAGRLTRDGNPPNSGSSQQGAGICQRP